jgi:hypothetical protein
LQPLRAMVGGFDTVPIEDLDSIPGNPGFTYCA